jgi:hypothetical protein
VRSCAVLRALSENRISAPKRTLIEFQPVVPLASSLEEN